MKITLILLLTCLMSCATQPNKTVTNKAPIETAQTSPVNKSTAAVKIIPSKSIDAIEFLSFAESFSNLSIDAQKQALAETNQVLTLNPNDMLHRMRLVMIYGLPSSMVPDTIKAQQLLQKIMQENILANSQLAFANLLFEHLVVANKISKHSNGDQKRVEGLQQKNEALQLKLDITQQKLEAALQKLDELRKIEKSMGERDLKPK